MRTIYLVIVIVCLVAVLLGLLLGKSNCRQKDRYTPQPNGGNKPIVLIPGLASSRLYGVWQNIKDLSSQPSDSGTVESFPSIGKYIEDHWEELKHEFEHDFVSPDCEATQDTWHRIWVDLSAAMPIPDYPDCWQKLIQTKYVPRSQSGNDPRKMNVNTFAQAENSDYRKRYNFGGSTTWREEIPNESISEYSNNGVFTWAGAGNAPAPKAPITRDFGGLCGCSTLAALEEKDCVDLAPAGVFLTLIDYLTGKKGNIDEPYEAPRFLRGAVKGECESGDSWCANAVEDKYRLCDCSGESVKYMSDSTPIKNSSDPADNLDDIDLVAAPYDWTKCLQQNTAGIESDEGSDYLDIYFGHLKRLIEFQYWGNKGTRSKKVCVVSHSLGCVMFKVFLDWYLPRRPEARINNRFPQQWKDMFVEIWIPLAGPFAGAPKALKAVISGDDEGLGTVCKAEAWKCNEKRNCMSWYQSVETQAAGLLMCCPDDIAMKNLDVITLTNDITNCPSVKSVKERLVPDTQSYTTEHADMRALLSFTKAVPGSVWLKTDPTLVGSYYALSETWWGEGANTPLQYTHVDVPASPNDCNSKQTTGQPSKQTANIMYTHPGVNCLHIYGSCTASSMKTPTSYIYGNYGDSAAEYNQFAPSPRYEQTFYDSLLRGDSSPIQDFLLRTKEKVAVVGKQTTTPVFRCVSPVSDEKTGPWMVGDGTVPWLSLRVSELWANENDTPGTTGTVNTLCLMGEHFDHLGLISQEQTWLVIAAQLGIRLKEPTGWYQKLVKDAESWWNDL